MKCLKLILLLIVLLQCSCAASKRTDLPLKIDNVRKGQQNIESVSYTVSRSELARVLQDRTGKNSIRLIEVFRTTESLPFPVYRVFGVQEGSAYDLIGIKQADIIVAANDYIIRNPELFVKYVQLLPVEPSAHIELERGGYPLIIDYRFTE